MFSYVKYFKKKSKVLPVVQLSIISWSLVFAKYKLTEPNPAHLHSVKKIILFIIFTPQHTLPYAILIVTHLTVCGHFFLTIIFITNEILISLEASLLKKHKDGVCGGGLAVTPRRSLRLAFKACNCLHQVSSSMAQKIKCETLPTPASILLKLQHSASSVSSRSVSAEIYFQA